jgi:hypothetical protein
MLPAKIRCHISFCTLLSLLISKVVSLQGFSFFNFVKETKYNKEKFLYIERVVT